jgi:DNA-binding CsgD family transcriptional regulator
MQALAEVNFAETQPVSRQDFGLTDRERQVVALVAAGCRNKDIAERLGISNNTTKHHIANIFDKLGVFNRLELLLFAIEKGLSDPNVF